MITTNFYDSNNNKNNNNNNFKNLVCTYSYITVYSQLKLKFQLNERWKEDKRGILCEFVYLVKWFPSLILKMFRVFASTMSLAGKFIQSCTIFTETYILLEASGARLPIKLFYVL